MAASLLAVGRTTITNVPAILDVRIMVELLSRLGRTVDYDAEAGTVSIDVPAEVGIQADYELVRAMRASISVLGPLTARMRAPRGPARRRRDRLARSRHAPGRTRGARRPGPA